MNSKFSPRFSMSSELRSAFGPQTSKAVYSRSGSSRPGHYIIRLRLQHSQSQFRPRMKFL
jgi:hypothetical protein